MSALRCIVVGLGSVTTHMLRVLDTRPWYETVGVVDVRRDALERMPDVPGCTDLAAALERVDADAVLVNTPSELHYEQAKLALEAGLHVLVAKPLTNDFAQAVELVELAAERGVTLSVGQQMRYMRHYRAVERLIASGRLGSVEAVSLLNAKPRPSPGNLARMDQPVLYEIACHHFDSLLALLRDRTPESISCDGFRPSWSDYAGPCTVNAWLRFSGGVHVLYHAGLSARALDYELRLEGSDGALRCRGLHMSLDEMTSELAAPGGPWVLEDIADGIPAVNPWEPFGAAWREYVDGGPEPSFSGRNNLRVFALLSAGIESAGCGGAPAEVAADPRYAAAFAAGVR